jgi:DNA-binding NarL/FixJ family response regulator
MHVLIAEDDALHRTFARTIVEELWSGDLEVLEASDGEDAIGLAVRHSPSCVVLDLQLPKVTGIEVARAIWSRSTEVRILFWSNFADEAYVRGVARIVPPGSVYGYVLKSASEDGMRSALRGVLREGHCIIDREIRGIQHRVQDRLEGITDSEYESLIDIALGLTDKTIALRRGLSIRGAQSRIQHLYDKFGLSTTAELAAENAPVFNPRTRAIHLAICRGLINADVMRREQHRLAAWLANAASSMPDSGAPSPS